VITLRRICVINQKGGVGKTTTAISIAAGLSRHDRKVLVIDLDPQGNVALCLNAETEKDIYHVLSEDAELKECIKNLGKNLDIISSCETLAKTEMLLAGMKKKEYVLREKLKELNNSDYDYVIIDCPPSIGLLNRNALLYAQEAFIPVSTEHLGFDALAKMQKHIDEINEEFDHKIKITKVIPTLFDRRNKTCRIYLDKINNNFYDVVTNPVRINSKLKEAPAAGKSIFSYAPSSNGSKDYMEVVQAVLSEEKKVLSVYPHPVTNHSFGGESAD
jgi:chromosome partitioning protein